MYLFKGLANITDNLKKTEETLKNNRRNKSIEKTECSCRLYKNSSDKVKYAEAIKL